MLPYFPTPYPDETLYSLIARYHRYSGNLTYISTMRDIFGGRCYIGTSNMPNYIRKGNLINALLSVGLNENDILYKHTAFPFIVAFKNSQRREEIYEMLLGHKLDKQLNLKLETGANKYFQHCSKCINEDLKQFGETYWHRVHQIPGVFFCVKHKEPLKRKLYNQHNNYDFELPNENTNLITGYKDINNGKMKEFLIGYAKEVNRFLNLSNLNIFTNLQQLYKNQFYEKGYLLKNGNINKKKLKLDLNTFYEDKLDYFDLSCNSINSMVNRLTSKIYNISATKHLLIIIFLCNSIKGFLKTKRLYQKYIIIL